MPTHAPPHFTMTRYVAIAKVVALEHKLDALPAPNPIHKSPYAKRIFAKRAKILELRKEGVTWPEIVPIIFPRKAPPLRTFKRIWALLEA